MENQNFYEGRILVNMAASVMRQDDLKPLHGNLDWHRTDAIRWFMAAIAFIRQLGVKLRKFGICFRR